MKKIIYIIIMFLCLLHCLHAFTNTSNVKLTLNIYNGAILFDDFNSHFWWGEKPGWADEVTASWVNFDNRDCLKVNVTNIGNNFGLFRTDHFFAPESWESPQITNIRCDIYLNSGDSGIKVKVEIRDKTENLIEAIYHSESLAINNWVNVTWVLNQGLDYSEVSKLTFVVDWLNGIDSTLFFNNLKLTDNSSIEYIWDDFDDESNRWLYADYSDATNFSPYVWYGACEGVSHNNVEGPTTNAGCLYMKWNSSIRPVEDYAKVESKDINLNLNNLDQIKIRVRCSSASANIKLGFDDYESHYLESDEKNVSTADQWETLTWNLPAGTFNWNNVKKIMFIVKTDTVATGEIFIDDIKFLSD